MPRSRPHRRATLLVLLAFAGCDAPQSGPIEVSAIGGAPRLADPNRSPLDPPSAFLAEAVAQGLVRFDQAGDIEPALAQSWIISDDGLRYTFRLRRDASWADGSRVTAYQVAALLRAALSRNSRNPLKTVLGAIGEIAAMTDEVLEISLRGPRPSFLELLAQPEMAIVGGGGGTGPYRAAGSEADVLRLRLPASDEDDAQDAGPAILLRGEQAPAAIARYARGGRAALVLGGTMGDLPLARAADPPGEALVFDPVNGLFGLSFAARDGPLADGGVRRALTMAIDRATLAAALGAANLTPRMALVPAGARDLAGAFQPDWAARPQAERRTEAARTIAALGLAAPLRLRVAMPDGPGYRLVFAYLRHDWRLIGVEAVRVAAGQPAELNFIDEIAPAHLASWYLRHFTCAASAVCDPAADEALLAARMAPSQAERQAQFSAADRILTGLTPFIPLTQPVRWSLVPRRLTGFRPNPFARHPAANLIAERP